MEPLSIRNPPCGLAPAVVGLQVDRLVNPTAALWPDPYFPGTHCRVDISATVAELSATRPGTYELATTEMGKQVPFGTVIPPYIGIDPHVSPRFTIGPGEPPPPPPPPPPPTCPITIRVDDWSRAVPIGGRGTVRVTLAHSFPIVQLQVKLNTQVIGEVTGTDLRDLAGLYFSVPRVPGAYNITVAARDATCTATTTATRLVTVQ
jgi:hypothetical protein